MRLDSCKLSQIPPHINSLLFIFNALNNAISITSDDQSLTLQQLILPLFLATFAGPILANIVFSYFTFTIEAFVSFFIALVLFSTLKRVKYMQNVYKMAPLVGKVLMICDMKNKDACLHLLAFWVLVSNFIGNIAMKILLKKQLELSENEFKDVLGTILCLIMARHFQLNDIYTGIMTIGFIIFLKKDVIFRCCNRSNIQVESVDSPNNAESEIKTPRKRGRPKKIDSMDSDSQTPRRASSNKIDSDE